VAILFWIATFLKELERIRMSSTGNTGWTTFSWSLWTGFISLHFFLKGKQRL